MNYLKVKEKIMNDIIVSNNVIFEKFSKLNKEHLKIAKVFEHDELINKYFSEWEEITRLSIDDDSNTFYSYVVSIDNVVIGILTITFTNDLECILSLGFLPEYRGKGNAGIVRSAMLDYLFSLNIKKVKGYIRKDNINNLRSIAKMKVMAREVSNTDLYEVIYEKETRGR